MKAPFIDNVKSARSFFFQLNAENNIRNNYGLIELDTHFFPLMFNLWSRRATVWLYMYIPDWRNADT